VIAVGAIPIGVDVDSDGLIDLEQFADVASTVDAVLPVHMHGSPVDMQALSEICIAKSKNDHIKIIEDASQAHGVLMKNGTTPGHYSDAVVYSLYPTKNLGALGDAGIVTTNHEDVADKLRILGSYGSRPQNKYEHVELGFNNRLDSLQAAVLSVNLERLHDWNAVRRKLSEIYIEKLSGNIRILQEFRSDSVRHHLCILSENRGSLKEFLLTKGITTEIHYPKVAGKEALRFLNQQGKFPKAESIANETLSLPLSQWHSTEQVSFVADKILDWISH
jgi:dTDP-4-amino-4,6-dideoxygalactose transaminase